MKETIVWNEDNELICGEFKDDTIIMDSEGNEIISSDDFGNCSFDENEYDKIIRKKQFDSNISQLYLIVFVCSFLYLIFRGAI